MDLIKRLEARMKAGEVERAVSALNLIIQVVNTRFTEMDRAEKASWVAAVKRWKARLEAARRLEQAEAAWAKADRELDVNDPESWLRAVNAAGMRANETNNEGWLIAEQELAETLDQLAKSLDNLRNIPLRLIRSKERAAKELGLFIPFVTGILLNLASGGTSSGVGGADDFFRGRPPSWWNPERPRPPLPVYMGDPALKKLEEENRLRQMVAEAESEKRSLDSQIASLRREVSDLESERRRWGG